jgi:hypothetical protein
MSLVVIDPAKILLIQDLMAGLAIGGTSVGLYKNNVTPDHTTTFADLAECDFDGYVRKVVTGWTVSGTLDSERRAFAVAGQVIWSLTGAPAVGNQVYGYFIFDTADGDVLWIERFDGAPIPMNANADFVAFRPVLSLRSEFNN